MKKKLILIDGSSFFFRAYYAIQRLSTAQGFPTNAIYGFANMLLRLIEKEAPKYLAIAFDSEKPTFRKELYTPYKEHRQAPPPDLVRQIPHILELVDAFGIGRIGKEGFEADDVLGTVAEQAEKRGFEVEIVTADKDLMQLVNANIQLYDPMRERRFDREAVKEKLGVFPEQVVDYLALMGDSSDNIPGVRGIGEKTAAELLQKFGSLQGLYDNLAMVPQAKRRETLEKEREMAEISQRLASVDRHVPLEIDWEGFQYEGPRKELREFLAKFELQSLLKRLKLEEPSAILPQRKSLGKYHTVVDAEALAKLVKALHGCSQFALDTETTSLSVQEAELVGLSFCFEGSFAYYIPVGHRTSEGQLPLQEVLMTLKPLLAASHPGKIGQNLKFDIQILRKYGITLGGVVSDTLVASYLLSPEEAHNLDHLAKKYLHHTTLTYSDVTRDLEKGATFAQVPLALATEYAAEDAHVAFLLEEKMAPLLHAHGLERLYQEVEIPIVGILSEMEYRGVQIDSQALAEMGRCLQEELVRLEQQIKSLAGVDFNVNSPRQLSDVLFNKLKLPVVRKTKTGLSTDESVLRKLSASHPICFEILRYRELGRLKSTYVEGLLGVVDTRTGRVHTHYNQAVTATGRLSSSNPNLQNIPTRGDGTYDIRSVFVAPRGYCLLSADYSQVELRLLAHFSGDPVLVEAFERGEDVHGHTAQVMFGEVNPEKRRIAKTINFGVVYGQTPFGLSQTLGIAPGQARDFIEAYFRKYAKVAEYLETLRVQARATQYAVTALGRRRYLPEMNSRNRMQRELAERAAINAPLQGTAADLIKIAMVGVAKELKARGLSSQMVLQVHDELVLEVAEGEEQSVEQIVREQMEGAMQLRVPLKIDIGWGRSWAEADRGLSFPKRG